VFFCTNWTHKIGIAFQQKPCLPLGEVFFVAKALLEVRNITPVVEFCLALTELESRYALKRKQLSLLLLALGLSSDRPT
jgi:hypothetical protein